MNYPKGKFILESNNLLINNRDMMYGWMKIRAHQFLNESFLHFMVKATIGNVIGRGLEGFITEHDFPEGGTIDVLQIKKSGEIIGYQIETDRGYEIKEFPISNIIVIETFKFPRDILACFKKIETYIKKVVV